MSISIGQKLTKAREDKGLSLLDAAHETRIPVQRLQQLESGNFAAFGSMTYARSFLRAYSRYLKVDAEETLEELPHGVLGGTRDYRYLVDNHGPWIRQPSNLSMNMPSFRPGYRRRSPVPAGMMIFALMLVGSWIWGSHVVESRQASQAAAAGIVDEVPLPPAPAPTPPVEAKKEPIPVAPAPVKAVAGVAPTPIPRAIPISKEEVRIFLSQKKPPKAEIVE